MWYDHSYHDATFVKMSIDSHLLGHVATDGDIMLAP